MTNILINLAMFLCVDTQMCADQYFDRLLSNYSIHSYYIQLDIKDVNGNEFKIITQNHLLYDFLKTEKGLSKEDYRLLVKSKLLNKQYLIIDTSKFSSFYVLMKDTCVAKMISKGRDSFIDHYFYNDGELRQEIDHEIPTIISILFDWMVPIRVDDESGNILVVRSFKCQ